METVKRVMPYDIKGTVKFLLLFFLQMFFLTTNGQDKEIKAPGSYSFSTLYSFDIRSVQSDKMENGSLKAFLIVKYRSDGQKDYEINKTSRDSTKMTYLYNDRDQLVKIERRVLSSGKTDYLKEFFYDAKNLLVKSVLNANNDALIEQEMHFEYDEKGNMIKETTLYPKYGTRKKIVLKEYDEKLNVTRESIDGDGDGVAEKITDTKYDGNNRQVYFKETNKNAQCTLITNQYKGRERMVTTSYYNNNDTFPHYKYKQVFDSRGINVLREGTNKFRHKGMLVSQKITLKWHYDTLGEIPTDFNFADDNPSSDYNCYYDKKGRKIKEEYLSDVVSNGKTILYTWSADGREETSSLYENSPKKLIRKYITKYDGAHNMISSQLFYGSDNKAAHIVLLDYDSRSNLVRRRVFANDTLLKNTDSFVYDAAGHKLRYFFIGKNFQVVTNYDVNGNLLNSDNSLYQYENFRVCPKLGKGLAHILKVEIPTSGKWEFNITNTGFGNSIGISKTPEAKEYIQVSSSDISSKASQLVIDLAPGIYYISIAGKNAGDAGDYKLDILKR